MSDQKLRLLRPLDKIERYHATRVYLGMDTCIAASARYTTPENTALTQEILFPALRAVIEKHAPLGMRHDRKPDSKDVAFCRLPSIDLSRVVEFSDRGLQAALEAHLSRGFDESGGDLPLWRLEVLTGNVVLLSMHHGIGDGLSTRTVLYSLFCALQDTSLAPYTSPVAVPNIPILPGIFQLINPRPSWSAASRMIWHAVLPDPWNRNYSAWTGEPFPTTIAIQTRVRLVSFEPSESRRFTDICRSHNATITGAFYELAVTVFSRLIAKAPDVARYKAVHISVASSYRHLLGGESDMCNYVESWPSFPRLHTEFSWDAAARATSKFKKHKAKRPANLGFLSWVSGDYTGWMTSELGKKRRSTLIISNLGRSDVPAVEGKWRMGEMFFAQADSLVGPTMTMNMVGDPAGGINLAITWGEKSVDSALAEEFVSLFRDAVLGMSQ